MAVGFLTTGVWLLVIRTPLRGLSLVRIWATVGIALGLLSAGGSLLVSRFVDSPWASVTASVAVDALVLGVMVGRVRHLTWLRGELARLDRPETRGAAAAALLDWLDRERPGPGEPRWGEYATVALVASRKLLAGGRAKDAERILLGLSDAELENKERAIRANNLAVCYLHQEDPARAREALELAPSLVADPATADMLQSTEAFVQVLEGNPRGALHAVGEAPTGGTGETSLTDDVVRSHCYAALDDAGRAREVAVRIRDRHGREALGILIAPRGPATDVALELMKRSDGPYR